MLLNMQFTSLVRILNFPQSIYQIHDIEFILNLFLAIRHKWSIQRFAWIKIQLNFVFESKLEPHVISARILI